MFRDPVRLQSTSMEQLRWGQQVSEQELFQDWELAIVVCVGVEWQTQL